MIPRMPIQKSKRGESDTRRPKLVLKLSSPGIPAFVGHFDYFDGFTKHVQKMSKDLNLWPKLISCSYFRIVCLDYPLSGRYPPAMEDLKLELFCAQDYLDPWLPATAMATADLPLLAFPPAPIALASRSNLTNELKIKKIWALASPTLSFDLITTKNLFKSYREFQSPES